MKKHFFSFFWALLALSSLFTSCSEEDIFPDKEVCYNVSVSCIDGGSAVIDGATETSVQIKSGEEVTVVATPDDGYAFVGWYLEMSEAPVSTELTYTITVKSDLSLVAKFGELQEISISNSYGGSVSFKNYEEKSVQLLPGEKVTVVATPAELFNFAGWYVGEEKVSENLEYTFNVSKTLSLVAKFVLIIGGHEYVDLGLPSGLKWATCNVGASSPENYGDYYAWGEIEGKSNCSWSTYKWCSGSYDTQIKYCTSSSYGLVDNKIVLDPEDDVAHIQWGGSWRMPTLDEMIELCNKCTWSWTTVNGVNGYKVTGPNGNSIFLPAAGCRNGTDLYGRGSSGYYWSSLLDSDNNSMAFGLEFYDVGPGLGYNSRGAGLPVRPVSE